MKKKLLFVVLIGLLALLVVGCNDNNSSEGDAKIEAITVEELKKELASGLDKDTVIVDLREPSLYDKEHIPGAILVPFAEFEQEYNQLDKDKRIILVCHMGPMGEAAGQFLLSEGYQRVKNLVGGMRAWDGK